MANEEQPTVRRTLQLRFTMPATDTTQFVAMIKAATPFYQMFGKAEVRLLQNVDDPAKFIQEIEYEADQGWELNRQRIASDARMQVYLQTWRTIRWSSQASRARTGARGARIRLGTEVAANTGCLSRPPVPRHL